MSPFDLAVTVLVGAAVAVGIVGTVLPILPGLGLVWLAMLAYGVALGFGWPGWIAMTIATGLAVLGTVLGVQIPRRRAAASGLSTRGQLVGLALAVVGFFLVPVVGAPLGFVFGVWLVRWWSTRDRRTAWASTKATVGALFRASAAQAACGVGMAAAWGGWVALG